MPSDLKWEYGLIQLPWKYSTYQGLLLLGLVPYTSVALLIFFSSLEFLKLLISGFFLVVLWGLSYSFILMCSQLKRGVTPWFAGQSTITDVIFSAPWRLHRYFVGWTLMEIGFTLQIIFFLPFVESYFIVISLTLAAIMLSGVFYHVSSYGMSQSTPSNN